MSFELFIRCLDEDSSRGLPRVSVRALFPVVEGESERDFWTIRYDPTNFCTMYLTAYPSNEENISFITIESPCGDVRLWESLVSLLRMGRVVLYFPGGPPIVTSETVRALVPEEEVATMGTPKCVQSAQDILDILRSS